MGSIPDLGRSSRVGNGDPPSILAWKILLIEEPDRLQSTGSQRVGDDSGTEQQQQIMLLLTDKTDTFRHKT